MVQAFGADDIQRLRQEGKVAVLLGLQNARILGEDLARVRALRAADAAGNSEAKAAVLAKDNRTVAGATANNRTAAGIAR